FVHSEPIRATKLNLSPRYKGRLKAQNYDIIQANSHFLGKYRNQTTKRQNLRF
ncbi:MAG: hypothetical protein ACI81T_001476, partial [Bacteroidia bacterium]